MLGQHDYRRNLIIILAKFKFSGSSISLALDDTYIASITDASTHYD
jgi:hypothetical protein